MNYLVLKDKIKITLLLVLIVAAIIFFDNLSTIYFHAESYIINLGQVKGLFFFTLAVAIIVMITPLPYSPFAVIAGAVFGSWLGMFATIFSATLGAVFAFIIGRYFLHDFFWKKFKKNKIYRKVLEEDHKHVLRFILISRLMPQAPFDMVSYFAGITTIRLWKFALANILGMLPIVILLSFFGSELEYYRVSILCVMIVLFILYSIYRIMRYKRYYVKGY